MVIDGISQVNNYGSIPPKTRVKRKITFSLRILSTQYITKSSTSFHPVDSVRAFVAPGSFLEKRHGKNN